MLRNILIVARRDFVESVKTKAFLFGLIVAPILFGSGFVGIALMKARPDIAERHVAIIDRTGAAASAVIESIRAKNDRDLKDKTTGQQIMPRYRLETIPVDGTGSEETLLALSSRVHPGDLYAFMVIGANVLHPNEKGEKDAENGVTWYSNETGIGQARGWLSGPVSDGIRRTRMTQAGMDPGRFDDLLSEVSLQNMNLVKKDEKTGQIHLAGKKTEAAVLVPIVLVMMIFMITMLTTAPMLNAIAEDKLQRVYEMLLASATPFELIAGKVLGALGRSVTSSIVYIAGALLVLNSMALMGVAPFELIPWFLVYLIAEITMLCALACALGAACGSPQDAQSLGIILFAPVLVPIMLLMPVMQNPGSGLATVMSFIPPFTPVIMLLRQSMPGGVPAWQPWVGLIVMTAGVIAIAWGASRVFRIAILMQGKPPAIGELLKWAIRG